MKNDLVTIVVPVYNAGKYLTHCLESICKQTYRKLQILLMDDGSTDGSAQLCDGYAEEDERIEVFHMKNAGVSTARNKGMQYAQGKYLCFIDSDDFLEVEMIENLVRLHQNGSLTICAYYIEYTKRDKCQRSRKIMYCDKEIISNTEDMISVYKRELFSSVWNKLYELSIIKNHAIMFREDMSLGEDTVFNAEYFKQLGDRIQIINTPLYHYCIRKQGGLHGKYQVDFLNIQKRIYYSLADAVGEKQFDIVLGTLFINAMFIAVDNLYENKREMQRQEYLDRKNQLLKDIREELLILSKGCKAANSICNRFRIFLLMHGLYVVERFMRQMVIFIYLR